MPPAISANSMQPAEAPCQIHDTLKARARADLKVYRDAVNRLQEHTGPDFREVHQKAEHARLAYEAARERLDQHILEHGACSAQA